MEWNGCNPTNRKKKCLIPFLIIIEVRDQRIKGRQEVKRDLEVWPVELADVIIHK